MITFLGRGASEIIPDDTLLSGSSTVGTTAEGLSTPIDPTGVVFLGGNLLVADSEINEEDTVFDGVNLWEWSTDVVTSSPSPVVATGLEVAPTGEPTGLAYNASNGHVTSQMTPALPG